MPRKVETWACPGVSHLAGSRPEESQDWGALLSLPLLLEEVIGSN